MNIGLTSPRQVRLTRCSIIYPGIEFRASNSADAQLLQANGFDITPFVQKLDIYESIFDNTLSGSVTLLENMALTEYLPLVGVEVLMVGFAIDTLSEEDEEPAEFFRAFRIVKLHDTTFPRFDARLYTLELATHEFLNSLTTRVCRRFSNMTCQQAVEQILKKDLDVDATRIKTDEATFGKVDVVIPNYTPLKAINYFALLSQTVKQPRESNFLFYETLDGFHFTSIQALIQAAKNVPSDELKTFNVNSAVAAGLNQTDTGVLNSIIRIHQERAFDLLFDIAAGTLRSRMVHVDFLARKFEHEEDSRYTETFKKTTHLDEFPFYPTNFDLTVSKDVRTFMVPSNIWSANSAYIKKAGEELPEQRMHESVVLRNRQLREIQHLLTVIDLPGQPDLRAGTVVNVNYPSSRELQGVDDTINAPQFSESTPYYSGKHLVTAVHHILATRTPGSMEYRMHIEVCKDSLGAGLVGSDITTERR